MRIKKERKLRREIINRQPGIERGFDVRNSIRQRKRHFLYLSIPLRECDTRKLKWYSTWAAHPCTRQKCQSRCASPAELDRCKFRARCIPSKCRSELSRQAWPATRPVFSLLRRISKAESQPWH